MKTIKRLSEDIATFQNFIEATGNYTSGKPFRTDIREFTGRLAANIDKMLMAYDSGTWRVPGHVDRIIKEHGKQRRLSIYPCEEHVMEWAALNMLEHLLTDCYIRNSCSCVRGRGQNDFVDILSRELRNDPDGTRYGVQLDAHHYFQRIDHTLLEKTLRRKIKDERLLCLLCRILESYLNGLVLGTKLSQIEANLFLSPFDHGVYSLWGVRDDTERMSYWRRRYVDFCIATVRTREQADELNKGVRYLGEKFDRLVRRGVFYARFADNIIMFSGDKAFLHICVEIAVMTITRDYHCLINRSWNVRPIEPDGMDVCGYVVFHFYRKERKRNKQSTWREITKYRRRGLTPEQIRIKCASRIGWMTHADCRNLLRKMNVNMEERLGKKIRKGRRNIPFDGMREEQKRNLKDYLCHEERDEESRIIRLLEYKVMPSVFNRSEQCAALRFQEIDRITEDADGNPDYLWREEQLYMWTGSAVLIDQMTRDIGDRLLPAPTAIYEMFNKNHKRFFKFT